MAEYTNGQEVEVLLGRDWQSAVYIGRNVPSRRYPHVVYRYGMVELIEHEKIRPKAPTLAEWLRGEECSRLRNNYYNAHTGDTAAWAALTTRILEVAKQ